MDDYSELAEALDLPMAELRSRVDRRLENPGFWNRHLQLLANVADTAKKMRGLQSSYALARAAVRFAASGELLELEADPFTGETPAVKALPTGGYVLASPGADALWRELFYVPPGTHAPPYEWPVPLPSRERKPEQPAT